MGFARTSAWGPPSGTLKTGVHGWPKWGTAAATGRLIERLGGRVEGYGFLVELGFLEGRARLDSDGVFSLIQYA